MSKQVLFHVEFTTKFEGKFSLKGRSLSNFIQASFIQKERELHMVGMIVKSFKFCTLKPPENKFLHLIFYLKYIHFPYCSSSDFLYTYLTFNFHGICVQSILFSRILKRSLSRRRVWKEKVVSKFF